MISKEQLKEELRHLAVKVDNKEQAEYVCTIFEFAGYVKYDLDTLNVYQRYIRQLYDVSHNEIRFSDFNEAGGRTEISYSDFMKKYEMCLPAKELLKGCLVEPTQNKDEPKKDEHNYMWAIQQEKARRESFEKEEFMYGDRPSVVFCADGNVRREICKEDILATDWELIQPKEKTLFEKGIIQFDRSNGYRRYDEEDVKETLKEIEKEIADNFGNATFVRTQFKRFTGKEFFDEEKEQ